MKDLLSCEQICLVKIIIIIIIIIIKLSFVVRLNKKNIARKCVIEESKAIMDKNACLKSPAVISLVKITGMLYFKVLQCKVFNDE